MFASLALMHVQENGISQELNGFIELLEIRRLLKANIKKHILGKFGRNWWKATEGNVLVA